MKQLILVINKASRVISIHSTLSLHSYLFSLKYTLKCVSLFLSIDNFDLECLNSKTKYDQTFSYQSY